jgi:hypothetical protein
MLKKTILVAAAAAAVGLAGCTPSSVGNSAEISQIQQAAVAACAFLPTVTTVADILAKNSSAVATAEQVAAAICAAVVPAPKTSSKFKLTLIEPINLSGITIDGKFVK